MDNIVLITSLDAGEVLSDVCIDVVNSQVVENPLKWVIWSEDEKPVEPETRDGIDVKVVKVNNDKELYQEIPNNSVIISIDNYTWYPVDWVTSLTRNIGKTEIVAGRLELYDIYNHEIIHNALPINDRLNIVGCYINLEIFKDRGKGSVLNMVNGKSAVNIIGLSTKTTNLIKDSNYTPDFNSEYFDKHGDRFRDLVGRKASKKYIEEVLSRVEATWRYIILNMGGNPTKRVGKHGDASIMYWVNAWGELLKSNKRKIYPTSEMRLVRWSSDKIEKLLLDNNEYVKPMITKSSPRIFEGAPILIDYGDGKIALVDGRRRMNEMVRRGGYHTLLIVEAEETKT